MQNLRNALINYVYTSSASRARAGLYSLHNLHILDVVGAEGWYRAGSGQLPGIATVRGLGEEGPGSNRAVVLEVSARLMQLRDLLGGREDIDIVHMLVREPR